MPLLVDARPHWTELTLDRPPRNVLDTEMLGALVATLDEQKTAGRPLLLKANGRHFSTGYPISEIPSEIFHHDPAVRAGTLFEQVMDRLVHHPAPILAAVQGDAYGGAVEMLACADLRVAADTARLGMPPVRLGLVYSHTGLRRLLRGFGSPLVREMLMLGEAISAERAGHAGFFNRVVGADELADTAEQMMRAITRGGPDALRGTRRILNLLEEWESLPDEALAEIGRLRHASRAGDEFQRAREAFLNKEPSPFGEGD
ncbi:enoyl-CoA hydratase/isomerase family protein [bacterium]|nr:enoyl-CoA hydratase/isomerase family protein [bacterium]